MKLHSLDQSKKKNKDKLKMEENMKPVVILRGFILSVIVIIQFASCELLTETFEKYNNRSSSNSSSKSTSSSSVTISSSSSSIASSTPSSSSSVSVSPMKVGEWLFSGNANDTSGNLIHGTVSGAILTNDRFGNTSCSYYFNGLSAITVPNDGRLSMIGSAKAITFSVWIKPLAFPVDANHGKPIVSKMVVYNDTGYEYGLTLLYSTRLRLGSYYSYIESNPISLSNWYHIVTVMNNNAQTSKIYVNGVLQGSSMISYKNSENTVPVYIGKVPFNDGSSDYFTGMIDDVQFYNYELTGDEITNLYHNNGW